MTAAELEKQGVKDFQLDYAMKTLKRLAARAERDRVAAGTKPKIAVTSDARPRFAAAPMPLGLTRAALARLIALLLPLGLLGGALGSQYLGGLHPCEMCYWQRWPHGAAILLAALAFTAPAASPRSRTLTLLAALAIAVSGAIGVYHAGVELGIFEGLTTCTADRQRAPTASGHHQRAAGPLRPGAVVASSAFRWPAGTRSCRSAARR